MKKPVTLSSRPILAMHMKLSFGCFLQNMLIIFLNHLDNSIYCQMCLPLGAFLSAIAHTRIKPQISVDTASVKKPNCPPNSLLMKWWAKRYD